jgi:putative acetyltransferase
MAGESGPSSAPGRRHVGTRYAINTGSPAFAGDEWCLWECGFVECAPFADYVLDPNSVFMTLEL